MNFYSIGFEYQNITGQSSDILRLQTSYNRRNEPWYFINALPSRLTLFIQKHGEINLNFLTILEPHQIIKFDPTFFSEKDKIYTYYRLNTGKLIPFLESYKIILQSKTVKFGAVTYEHDGGSNSGTNAGFYDIKGIWLANKLPIPLDVYYKGDLVVQLYPYRGLNYLGGAASEVYFDNQRQGLNYLDTLEFKYSLPGASNKFLFNVILDDVKCTKMFIGTVSSSDESPYPDNAVYRIQEPNYVALTYFNPVGGGKSMMTNPSSPFYS